MKNINFSWKTRYNCRWFHDTLVDADLAINSMMVSVSLKMPKILTISASKSLEFAGAPQSSS